MEFDKELLRLIREEEHDVQLRGFGVDAYMGGCHENHLYVRKIMNYVPHPSRVPLWNPIQHLGIDSGLAAEYEIQTLLMQAESQFAVAGKNSEFIWTATINNLKIMLAAATYQDKE